MAALATATFPAPATHAAGVVVRLADRVTRIDEAALHDATDVPAGTYTLRARVGAGDPIAHPAAVSLPRLLELTGVAPDALSFVTVRRPNGTLTVLHAHDLARPAPFPDGPPLVWLDADSVRFLRPVRDDADVNGADNIATAGDDLAVQVHQGPLLAVALRVAPPHPRAGERTHLEARITGAPPGTSLIVRWRFGDGTEATGAAVSHRWTAAGVYAIVASAEGDDDSGGASEPFVVVVRARRERAARSGGGTGDPQRAPATGPTERPADPTPSPPSPSPAPPTSGAHRSAPRAPRTAAEPPAPPRKQRLRARRAPPGGVPVRGVLVAAILPADAVPPPRGAAGSPAAARRGTSPEHRDVTLAGSGAIACSLLALGASRERRRRRP